MYFLLKLHFFLQKWIPTVRKLNFDFISLNRLCMYTCTSITFWLLIVLHINLLVSGCKLWRETKILNHSSFIMTLCIKTAESCWRTVPEERIDASRALYSIQDIMQQIKECKWSWWSSWMRMQNYTKQLPQNLVSSVYRVWRSLYACTFTQMCIISCTFELNLY